MAIDFPTRSLPPEDEPPVPLADVAFYFLLKEHPALARFGLTVELALEPSARVSPFVRVQVTRYLEAASPGELTPICSLDIYADDLLNAGDVASEIVRVWPHLKKVTVPGEAYVSGAWVEVLPYRIEEPDGDTAGASLSRYHLEVGLRLHPTL